MSGLRAPLGEISLAALLVAAGMSTAAAQTLLDPITVIATKTSEKTIDTLAMVSSVRQEQLERIVPSRVAELFFGLPSVTFRDRADSPETAINIRGLQDFGRVAVVVDGARQNFQRSGHNANGAFFLEPETIAEVDVSRGPVSNIYGSGAIGGVVSFRTKDAEDVLRANEKVGALLHGTFGSNQRQALGSFFGAARPNQNIDLFAGGTYRSQADYKDGHGNTVANSAFDMATGIAKATVRPAEGHEIKVGGTQLDSRYRTGQLPSQESVYNTHVRNTTLTGRYRYGLPDDKLFNFDGSVYLNNTRQDQTKILGTNNSQISGSIGDSRFFLIETQGFDLNNTSRFDLGEVRNAFTVGGDLFRDDVTTFDPTGTGDVLTPGGIRQVSGAFAQLKSNYRWLEVIGALRYDRYQLDSYTDHASGDRLSPKLTVGVTPVNGFTVYGTYAEGYRAPAVTETLVAGPHASFLPGSTTPLFTFLPNPNLRPEIGQTKEVGVNLKYDDIAFKGDKLRIKANVFRNDIEDYIELVNFGPPVRVCPPGAPVRLCNIGVIPLIQISPFSFSQYQNIGNARIEGVELEGSYDTGDWFLGLQGQHIRGRDLTGNLPLLTVQPDQVTTTLGVRLLERKLTMSVSWQAVAAKTASEIPDRDRNGFPDFAPANAYNLVNLYVGYQPTPDALAYLGIDNLFNQYYVRYMNAEGGSPPSASNPPPYVFPSPGITLKGGLKLRFGA